MNGNQINKTNISNNSNLIYQWQHIRDNYATKPIQLGLERVKKCWQQLNLPQPTNLIIVAGTNGKGSSCAMLEAIYQAQGYKVGLYTSPHLLSFHERIRINQKNATDQQLDHAFTAILSCSTSSELSQFELDTLAAVYLMVTSNVDLAILEVGLGGRLDATNIFSPDASLVCSIDLDHIEWLGDTREKIALEKAAIFRKERPAICSDPNPPNSLISYANQINADLYLFGRDFGCENISQLNFEWQYWFKNKQLTIKQNYAPPCLRGKHQYYNSCGVLTTVHCLQAKLPVTSSAIRNGLINPQIQGRMHILPGRPSYILDVAHNPQSAKALAENLSTMGYFQRTFAIVGMLADKDIKQTLFNVKEQITDWLLVSLPPPRGATALQLVNKIDKSSSYQCFESVELALQFTRQNAKESDRIVIFGSFVTVAEAYTSIKKLAL